MSISSTETPLFAIPEGVAQLLADLADQKAASRDSAPARIGVLSAVEQAMALRQPLPRLVIGSAANPSYQKRADEMFALYEAGEAEALSCVPVNGKNTYSRALRLYRDILVDALVASEMGAWAQEAA